MQAVLPARLSSVFRTKKHYSRLFTPSDLRHSRDTVVCARLCRQALEGPFGARNSQPCLRCVSLISMHSSTRLWMAAQLMLLLHQQEKARGEVKELADMPSQVCLELKKAIEICSWFMRLPSSSQQHLQQQQASDCHWLVHSHAQMILASSSALQ